MVLDNDLVVPALVIEAKVVAQERRGLNLRRIKPQEVDLRVVLDLDLFIVGHPLVPEQLEGLAAGHGELDFVDADSRGRLLRVRVVQGRICVLDTLMDRVPVLQG